MKTVGVRELRQRASELLRQVQAGATFEITDRDRPIALLAPLPDAAPLERLRAAGEVSAPVGDLDELPRPLALPPGETAPSVRLAHLRAHDR